MTVSGMYGTVATDRRTHAPVLGGHQPHLTRRGDTMTTSGTGPSSRADRSALYVGPINARVRSTTDGDVETWDDPERGIISFRTLFSREVSGSAALITGVAEVPERGRFADHRHDQTEVYFVLEGRGLIRVGDVEAEVSRGSAVHVPGGEPHGITNTGKGPLRLVYTLAADAMADVRYDFTPAKLED